MKILQINNNFSKIGGAEVVFHNTINLLRENGNQVISFSRVNTNINSQELPDYFINHSNLYMDRFSSSAAKIKIQEIIKKDRPDIVHIHNLIGGITFSILPILKKENIPIVMTVHDFRIICPAGLFMNRKNEICEKCTDKNYFHCAVHRCSPYGGYIHNTALSIEGYLRAYFYPYQNLIDYFIFVSNFEKKKYLEYDVSIENKATTIYNFTNQFSKQSYHNNYFLYFGRLISEKGIFTLLKAFEINSHLKLKIVGDGYLREEIEKKKTPNVEVVGYRQGEELNKLIQNACFIIVPSECYETMCMAVVESFAMGKPVIGSNIGALPELIKDGETGFLFTPKDIKKLSSLINVCSSMLESEYNKLSKSAYDYAINNFSTDVHYKQLMDVYESVGFQMNFTSRSSLYYD